MFLDRDDPLIAEYGHFIPSAFFDSGVCDDTLTSMKFPLFDYACPTSLAEAVALLHDRRDEAMVLAGGQSLMPLLAFRLAMPRLLVDLKNIPGLDTIRIGAGGVGLGARVRWCDIEENAELPTAHPLLAAAIRHVAHYQIRNRGTVGGSIALADPAAEMPGIAVTCDAEIAVTGNAGARVIKAADFFLGPMATCLAPDEIITQIRLPPWPRGRRWAFEEFARRRGDFALAGIALFYDLEPNGDVANAHIGVIGASDRPHRLMAAEKAINGAVLDAAAIAAAADAASSAVDPMADHHAPADYRRALVATLVERALARAAK
jgi:carbon-monoxide dehydrogenase medium subunit